MARYRRASSPALAAVVALLLLLCVVFHCAAAARTLPAAHAVVSLAAHHSENGVKDAADGLPAAGGNGGDGLPVSKLQVTGGAEEEAEACEEGRDDECVQRRLLHDAHLDYIYTQHKGKP